MQLFILFMFGVLLLAAWEVRGSRQVPARYLVAVCAVIAVAFTSLRVV